MRITRRAFVSGALTVGMGMALGVVPDLARWHSAQAAAPPADGHSPAVLYDLTRCVGCHLCETACQENKGLPKDVTLLTFRKPYPEVAPDEAAWAVRRHQCMHCLSPACVSACPVGAMQKTAAGPVIYRDERCLGCRYCMNACPFGVPTFDWNRGIMDGALIRKCDFCADRQAAGKRPACIEACPTAAVTFGNRADLLARAKELIRQHPDQYVDHIYGETEAGGTSFLMISGVPFDKLGLPKPGSRPLTVLPEKVMGATIPFALTWAAVLSGVTGLVRFRAHRLEEKAGHSGEEDA